jgi:hypothetical protein
MGFPPPTKQLALDRYTYRSGSPWHHLVVDGAFDPDLVVSAASFIANLPDEAFVWQLTRRIHRGTLSDQEGMGAAARSLWSALTSDEFVDDLGDLTGIAGLSSDPHLSSAGVYITPPGGWQRVHQDFPRHPVTGLWSRVAVLLYLSDWQPGDGGELELWPEDMVSPPTMIEPRPGRMVIFAPTAQTLHGIRKSSSSRRRIALGSRYYSAVSPSVLPRPAHLRTVRRPGEHFTAVLPTSGEIRDYFLHRGCNFSRDRAFPGPVVDVASCPSNRNADK